MSISDRFNFIALAADKSSTVRFAGESDANFVRRPRKPATTDPIILAGSWLVVDPHSVGEVWVVFQSRDRRDITAPVLLTPGTSMRHDATYMVVVGIRRGGPITLLYGDAPAVVPNNYLPVYDQASYILSFGPTDAWAQWNDLTPFPIGLLKCDALLYVSPTPSGLCGETNSVRLMNRSTYDTAHFYYVAWGFCDLVTDDAGLVRPGAFNPIYTGYNNEVRDTLINPWSCPAVQFLRTPAGVAAGAYPPSAFFSADLRRHYNVNPAAATIWTNDPYA